MADFKSSLSSNFFYPMDTLDDPELTQRLGLYQLFLKLYHQHRGLLDEILSLENFGNKQGVAVKLPYIQGLVMGRQIYLLTNLIKGTTQLFSQAQHIWTIGRDSRQTNLSIQDKRLSRCHAAIQYVEGRGFYLIDLGSSNGSFVNGELVKQATLLKDGTQIRLGSLAFTFLACDGVQPLELLTPERMAVLRERGLKGVGTGDRLKPVVPVMGKGSPSSNPIEDTLHFMKDQVI
jgi:pSer/pThr/pTyr-binding forkhead associated (FHA) protein